MKLILASKSKQRKDIFDMIGLKYEVVESLSEEKSSATEPETYVKELSKGNQQKIQFILAILNKPKLLILDEPFSGLDPFNVELFKQEIVELSESGSMIIFSSHRMEHVELFCKKLAIIMKGKTVIEGYLKDIKEKYRKKNIFIKANIKREDLTKIPGVVGVIEKSDEFEIKDGATLAITFLSPFKSFKTSFFM